MKRFQWAIAMLLAVLAQGAYADSIPTFNITQATVFVGFNDGSGDNVFFVLSGPGTSITDTGGIGCFDWCSFNTFSPGDSPPLSIGQIFLDSFNSAKIGGQTYDPATVDLFGLSIAVLGGFTFPANPNGSTFSTCVPGAMPGSIGGIAGEGDTFIQFNLKMPAGGKFCTTWNFDAASGQYGYSQGTFVATTVPEPGTLGLIMTGLAGIVAVIRRKRDCGCTVN